MAGFQTGAYSLPKVNLGMDPQPPQGGITPEMMAQLLSIFGGGADGSAGLLSQAINPGLPRQRMPIGISGGATGEVGAVNPLTGQAVSTPGGEDGRGGQGGLDWIGALAGDIGKTIGPIANPILQAGMNPSPNPPGIATGQYTSPSAAEMAGGITQPIGDLASGIGGMASGAVNAAGPIIQDYITKSQNMPPPEPVDWGKMYSTILSKLGSDGSGVENLKKVYTDPSQITQIPFKRDPSQTGFQNTLAGLGNAALNIPATILHTFGGDAINTASNMGADALRATVPAIENWLTVPEAKINEWEKAKFDKAHPDAAPVQFNLQPQGGGKTPGGLNTPAPLQTNVGGGTQQAGTQAPLDPVESYLQQTVTRESSGNPNAQNSKSSAGGLGQFLDATWMQYVQETDPAWARGASRSEILQKKYDPDASMGALRWYTQKGVGLMDELGLPPTSANLYAHHFLGPGQAEAFLTADLDTPVSQYLSASTIKANPWLRGMTTQDLHNNFEATHGDGTNIGLSGPTPRPQQQAPDFTGMNNWMDEARPKPTDAQLLKNAQLGEMLQGWGNGLSAPYSSGGDLFGNLAAGTGTGARMGAELALKTAETDEAARAAYAGTRGGLEFKLAALKSDLANGNMDRVWQDKQDISAWMNQQVQSQLEARKTATAAAKPTVLHTSDNALVYQDATGVHKVDLSQNTLAEQYEKTAKAYGLDSTQARVQKYQGLTNFGQDAYMQELVKDAVADGNAKQIFGAENYKAAMDSARKEVEETGLNIASDGYQEALNKRLAGWLFIGTKQSNDTAWVQRSSELGNPGAQYLWANRTSAPTQ